MKAAAQPKRARLLAEALADEHSLLLYDGTCGLCDGFVQLVLRHDRHRSMRFATLQGRYGEAARRAMPELAGVDSVVLVTRSGAYVRSTAALEVMRYLGGVWSLFIALYVLPRPLRDWGYDFIAKRRYRIWGRVEACALPSPENRARFLDLR
jgi:predicted DCC family thiol-disulfide oxidoreductase YuxK